MKVLMTVQPGFGHFHPMLPFAEALQQAGHTVAFATSRSFCATVETAGFSAFPAGLDWLEWDAERSFPELREMSLAQQQLWYLREVFADIAGHRMARDVIEIGRTWQPDVIVRSSLEFGGCVAAEVLDIPHATTGIGQCNREKALVPLIGDQLAYLRSAFGLTPYPSTAMLYRYLYLATVAPSFDAPEFPLPATYHAIRPVFTEPVHEVLPEWVHRLPERPTVHATLGTVFNRFPDVYRTIIEGLRDEPITLIVSVGRNQDIAQFGKQPENVHIEQYLPHTALLPYCDALITHGGGGTLTQAMSHGLPLVVIPLSAEQPFHAARCAELGIGIALKLSGTGTLDVGSGTAGAGIEARWPKVSPESVRQSVRALLSRPQYQQNAQRLRQEIEALPGPAHAVELLCQLVTERTPRIAA